MAQPRATMMHPPIESLIDATGSKFTLVTLSAMRARQINSYYNQLSEGLGAIVPPQVTSPHSRKPLSISLEEIAEGKIIHVPIVPQPEGEGDEVDATEGE